MLLTHAPGFDNFFNGQNQIEPQSFDLSRAEGLHGAGGFWRAVETAPAAAVFSAIRHRAGKAQLPGVVLAGLRDLPRPDLLFAMLAV